MNRRVVRIGAAAAVFSIALFLVVALITGDPIFYLQMTGPALVAVLMIAQVAMGKEHAGWALVGTALVVVGTYRFVGDESTLIPAALGVVIIASIAMLFVTSHQLIVTLATSASLLAVPFVWGIPASDAVALGAIMAVSFAFTASVFYAVRNAASALNRRFQVLFEFSPMAAVEVDLTDCLAYVGSEFSGRKDRIRGFLGAYPDVVRNAASLLNIVRANQAARDMLGVQGDFVIDGKTLPDGWVEWVRELLVAVIEERKDVEHEVQVPTPRDPNIWLSLRAVNVSAGDQPDGVLIALADVTHLKAKEDAMRDLIEAKDEFVASISHELRTPLTAVVGLTSEMADGGLGGSERDEIIELVASQAREMSYIIDDLLVAARAGMGTVSVALDTVDLNAELAAAADGVGIFVDEQVPTLPPAVGDGPRIRQILRNLLTNLERYGGSERRVLGGSHGGRVWIEVRDNGAGVPDTDAARIFEPYASAHTGVAGSVGLGLSVARQLAELMGGALTYRREEGESVFRLELAVARESLLV